MNLGMGGPGLGMVRLFQGTAHLFLGVVGRLRGGIGPLQGRTRISQGLVEPLPGIVAILLGGSEPLPCRSTMRFKVYVVLTTGNEKGSNAVAVTHPV